MKRSPQDFAILRQDAQGHEDIQVRTGDQSGGRERFARTVHAIFRDDQPATIDVDGCFVDDDLIPRPPRRDGLVPRRCASPGRDVDGHPKRRGDGRAGLVADRQIDIGLIERQLAKIFVQGRPDELAVERSRSRSTTRSVMTPRPSSTAAIGAAGAPACSSRMMSQFASASATTRSMTTWSTGLMIWSETSMLAMTLSFPSSPHTATPRQRPTTMTNRAVRAKTRLRITVPRVCGVPTLRRIAFTRASMRATGRISRAVPRRS